MENNEIENNKNEKTIKMKKIDSVGKNVRPLLFHFWKNLENTKSRAGWKNMEKICNWKIMGISAFNCQ